MPPIIDTLMPRNKTQRIGIFVAMVMSLLVIFLHNPLDGYVYFHGWEYYLFTINFPHSIWEVQSNNPIVYWFGIVSHSASAFVAIWILCLAWLYLFRTE